MRPTWKFSKVCFSYFRIQKHEVNTPPAEDEEPDYVDDDDEPINPLVDALFDEIETLRIRVSRMILYKSYAALLTPMGSYLRVKCAVRSSKLKPGKRLWKRWRTVYTISNKTSLGVL